jgi:DNA-binding NtrC family response regulator
MVIADPVSQALVKLLARIAACDVPVVISGDAGTGKEVVARYIHSTSSRSGAFLAVNCRSVGACAEEWFEGARNGTLFLDEIADLSPSLQNQLLQALQERESIHPESREPGLTDVRLIAATQVDLGEAVAAGYFRLELFYRLNVGQVRLLPLRQRQRDVPALAAHFLRTHGKRLNVPLPTLSPEALAALEQHSWPGNVRELENVIQFALLAAPEREVRAEHLKLGGIPAPPPPAPSQGSPGPGAPPASLGALVAQLFLSPGKQLLSDLESQIVAEAFRFTRGNQVRTAALLGISRNALRTLLRKHALLVPRRRKKSSNGNSGPQ